VTLCRSGTARKNEALWVANELAKAGKATWRPGVDVNRVHEELKKWQDEKSEARMKLIFGDIRARHSASECVVSWHNFLCSV
jgi:hypothetical protein